MNGVGRRLSAALLCCVSLHVAPAGAGIHGEITDFGETTAEHQRPARQTPDDHTLVPRTLIEDIRYVAHTSSLPAQLCLRFGVSVRLHTDAGEQMPPQLIVVLTHPRITRPDQVFSTRDVFPTPVIGDTAYAGMTFDHAWEQQPGDWALTFMNGQEVVASKTFTITAPTPAGRRCPDPVS